MNGHNGPGRTAHDRALPTVKPFSLAAAVRDPWNRATLCLVVLGLLSGCERIWESDIFWHLTAGQWMLHHHILPGADIWSVDPTGRIVNVYWLFQLIVAGLHAVGGFAALSAMKSLLLGAIAFVLARSVPAASRSAAAIAVLTLTLVAVQIRTLARPEAFTFLYLVTVLWILESVRLGAPRRRLWGLVPIMVLWVNMHSLYVLGLVVIWTGVVGAWLQERITARERPAERARPAAERFDVRAAWIPAIAATLVCLVTPEPIPILLHPYVLWRQASGALPTYAEGFAELIPAWKDPASPEVWMAAALVLAAAFGIVRQRRRLVPAHVLWLAVFAYLGLTAFRNLALAALVAGGIAASTAGLVRLHRRALGGACALALVIAMLYPIGFATRIMNRTVGPGFGLQEDHYAVGIAQRIATSGIAGDILPLDFGDAGVFIYGANKDRLDPRTIIHRVWIDGRSDLHDRSKYERLSRIRDAIASSPEDAGRVDLPAGVRFVVVNDNDLSLIGNMAVTPRFELFHVDRGQVCFLRSDVGPPVPTAADNLAEYDRPLQLDPPQALLGPTERYRRSWYHQNPLRTHWKLGTVLSVLGRSDLAARYLECAELLGSGPASDRRGMLALAEFDLARTGGDWELPSGSRGNVHLARALWLLDQPGVCDIRTWEGRTYAIARVHLLIERNALDIADREIRRLLAGAAGRGREEMAEELTLLRTDLEQRLARARDAFSASSLSSASPMDQATALLRAGLLAEALSRLDADGATTSRTLAGDLRLGIGDVGSARAAYVAAGMTPLRAALCDWVEGRLARALAGLDAAAAGSPEDVAVARMQAQLRTYLGRS
jgi:hypothetical protein